MLAAPRKFLEVRWLDMTAGWAMFWTTWISHPNVPKFLHLKWVTSTMDLLECNPKDLRHWKIIVVWWWYGQWEFQDPKMEVLYHIRPYFVICPLIWCCYSCWTSSFSRFFDATSPWISGFPNVGPTAVGPIVGFEHVVFKAFFLSIDICKDYTAWFQFACNTIFANYCAQV